MQPRSRAQQVGIQLLTPKFKTPNPVQGRELHNAVDSALRSVNLYNGGVGDKQVGGGAWWWSRGIQRGEGRPQSARTRVQNKRPARSDNPRCSRPLIIEEIQHPRASVPLRPCARFASSAAA